MSQKECILRLELFSVSLFTISLDYYDPKDFLTLHYVCTIKERMYNLFTNSHCFDNLILLNTSINKKGYKNGYKMYPD